MTDASGPWLRWGEQLKEYRLRAGYASQTEFADALSHIELASGHNLILTPSQISRWENGQRCPARREQHLELIEGLVRLGGIITPEEADAWLQAGKQGLLSADERQRLFGEAALPPTLPVSATAVLHRQRLAPTRRAGGRITEAPVRSEAAPQDWGDAPQREPSGRGFHGRQAELTQLNQWAVDDGCRLVAILGMGGVGKTALAARLAREVAGHFDGVMWRSLLNAPPLDELLRAWLHFLSRHQLARPPASLDERLRLLLDYLRRQRCLLVLDNCEAILQGGERAGHYHSGYEAYGQLLRWMGEQEHQSCLLLTSRERPRGVARLERESLLVRSLELAGLAPEAGRALLQEQGLRVAEGLADQLVARYSGNPLAVKLVADTVQDLFGGDVAAFLGQETPLFDDIREVLEQQFARLSALEHDIVTWLAVEREPLPLPALEADLVQPLSRGETLAAVRALQRRSLLEQVDRGHESVRFTLQNVVTEYATDRLAAAVYQEIIDEQPAWLNRYALLKAQAKEYVRQNQERLLVEPLARRLIAGLGRVGLEAKLKRILTRLRTEAPLAPGYAVGNILNLLLHLGYDVRGYDFSHLAVWQACLRGMALQEVDFSHADLAGGVFTETFGAIRSVAISSDGACLAAAAGDGAVRLWQATAGWPSLAPYLTCIGHMQAVFAVSFSPDGRALASASGDQTVRLWDTQTGECLHILQGHGAWARSVSFSPDGRVLASSDDDQTVRLWDVQTGACIHILQDHTHAIWSVSFSPDGRTLATSSGDQTVRLWDVQSGACIRILQGHTGWVISCHFSPDGRTLATGSTDETVRLWDMQMGECIRILQGHTRWVMSVRFSPDSRILATSSVDGTVRLWNVQMGESLRILQGHTNWIWSVCFSPDGRALASGSDDQTVRLWDVQTGELLHILQGYTQAVRSVHFSPNGHTLASGGADQTVWLWDTQTGRSLHSLQGHTHAVRSVCFSPNDRILATGSDDQTVQLWDAQTGQPLHSLQGHTRSVYSVCFSPDSRILASSGVDGTVLLWDVQTGQPLHILQGHDSWVRSVCFSPDGHTLVSSSDDQTVQLWDAQTGESLYILRGHTHPVWSVCFSPDGRILASGSADQTIRLWAVQRGDSLYILRGHTQVVMSVCFSPNGRILASGGGDQSVRLWDAQTGEPLDILHGHTSWVNSVHFSPDGRVLASGSEDQTVRLWDTQTGEGLRILRSERPYERMNITGATGLTDAQKAALKALGAVEEP